MKLIGFCVWECPAGRSHTVSVPPRQWFLDGERRDFAMRRPIADSYAQDRVRELVMQAYASCEREMPASW